MVYYSRGDSQGTRWLLLGPPATLGSVLQVLLAVLNMRSASRCAVLFALPPSSHLKHAVPG